MSNSELSYEEQIKILIRTLQPEIYRYVFIQYNHRAIIENLKTIVTSAYKDRPFFHIDMREIRSLDFYKFVWDNPKGIYFLDRFEAVLENETFWVGFNQRRDRFTKYPIQFLVFAEAGEEYFTKAKRRMPDTWSLRNLVLDMEIDIKKDENASMFIETKGISTLGGHNIYTKKEELHLLLERIAELGDINPLLTNNLYTQATTILEDIGDYKQGLEKAEQWETFYKESKQDDDDAYIDIQLRKASFLSELGNYETAKTLLYDLLEKAEAINKESKIAAVQNDLALVLKALGEYSSAKSYLQKALALDEKNFGPNHPTTAGRYSNLGIVLKDLGDYSEAKKYLKKALASDEKNFGPDHPNTAIRYSNIATVLRSLGDYSEAKIYFEKALASDEKNFDPDHPNIAKRHANLGLVLADLGEHLLAKKYLEKALVSDEKNFGPDHPTAAVNYSNLATVLKSLGDYSQAKTYLEKALDLNEKNLGSHHPKTAMSYSNLAVVLIDLEEYSLVKKYLEKALASDEKNFGPGHPDTARSYSNLASVLYQLQEYELAFKYIQKAKDTLQNIFPQGHPHLKIVEGWYEKIKSKLGEH